jgi:hypothetical protein
MPVFSSRKPGTHVLWSAGSRPRSWLLTKANHSFVYFPGTWLILLLVSMVDARWFDVLSEIGKSIRGGDKAFGGMQVCSASPTV